MAEREGEEKEKKRKGGRKEKSSMKKSEQRDDGDNGGKWEGGHPGGPKCEPCRPEECGEWRWRAVGPCPHLMLEEVINKGETNARRVLP